MEFKKLSITKEQAEEYFPVKVRPLLQREGAHVFAMLGEDIIYSLAVLTIVKEQPGTYSIQYLYCREGERDTLRELLLSIERISEKLGISLLVCRLIDEGERILDYGALLLDMGYANIEVGRSYFYYMDDLKDTILYDSKDQLERVLKSVRSYSQLNRRERIQFFEKIRNVRRMNLRNLPDPEYGLFFFDKDEIVGFANMKKMGDDVLYLEDTYVWKSKLSPYIRPALLLYGISKACEHMPEDTVFCYRTFSANINEMYAKLFGESEKTENILEFIKVI